VPKPSTYRRRRDAATAAATAFAGGAYDSIEELWSLTVFFERYLEHGTDGTLEQFGPADEQPANILKLVPKQ